MRVLAVNVDQHVAQLAQLRRRRRDPVDIRLRTARVIDHPAQQYPALIGRKLVCFQPGGGLLGHREIGRDVGLGRALAHHAGVAAPAQRQGQRVDQNRLAGAGLAGEDGKARRKFQFYRIDYDEIADGQGAQHGCLYG